MCSGVLVVVRAVAVVAIIGEVCVGVRLLCSWLLFVCGALVARPWAGFVLVWAAVNVFRTTCQALDYAYG